MLRPIATLNAAKPEHGFIWREYSPASVDICGLERRYFTQENAARIDAMRAMIADGWRLEPSLKWKSVCLIADLFGALNRVANIAGTFGCFLSKWTNSVTRQDRHALP
jgi:adenine-specific DNA-methyltransferase